MPDSQEDIVIIAEDDVEDFDNTEDVIVEDENKTKDNKKLIIISIVSLTLIIIIIISLFMIFSSSDDDSVVFMPDIEEKLEKSKKVIIEPSKLENMIAKANYLYSSGSKDKALSLYEEIAVYSEAISKYNLGVAQFKNKQYKIALKTFQQAIQNDEKRCVSAINAAVCSLYLNDKTNFEYYIDLAHAYLSNEIDSPLYSYYYALINYYKGNYLEALASLKNPTSKEYAEVQKHLKSKINALFKNDYKALENIEENFNENDIFNIALLYAKIGDITLAQQYFEDAILKNIEPLKSTLALAFINIKAGQVTTASKLIQKATDKYPEEVYKNYPIKVTLKDSLFNPEDAQNNYRKHIANNKLFNYQKIFYFSPYKLFNANNTISYIRKGNANIFIDDITTAKNYLKKSVSSSNVNITIAKAIKKALNFKIRDANKELLAMLKIQPKHSILHYDIALTFAQMGDMQQAYKHFLRSYHLDAKNYLSGIYALMCSDIIDKETIKLKSIISNSVSDEDGDSEELNLFKTLLHIINSNYIGAVEWLDKDYKQRPLYLMLNIIISTNLDRYDIAKRSSNKLAVLLPNDILTHIIYMDTHFHTLENKEYANKVLNYLKLQKFHFKDLYFGPLITRYLYIQENLMTGHLYFLRKQLKDVLESTKDDRRDLTSALALASLYDKKFEESYTLYNQLIDNLKVRDANTLFLGAVASTAANHHENAIALLELSKMKNSTFLESRYALGLLYLQVQNNNGAIIQLSRVGDNGFISNYFNFDIDLDKLTQKDSTYETRNKI